MTDLNYRRAKFIYESARLAAEAANAPIVPEPYDNRDLAFREQFEKVIEKQTGPERSSNAEQLHDDWVKAYEKMGWVYGPERDVSKKTHPDMVPYNELGHLERDKDAVFVALCEIARKWIHEPGINCDDKQELEKKLELLEDELDDLQIRYGQYYEAIGAALGMDRENKIGSAARSDAQVIRAIRTKRDEALRELRALEWLTLWSQGAVKNGPDVAVRVVSPICVAGAGVLVANASQSKRYPDYTSAALAQGWEEK